MAYKYFSHNGQILPVEQAMVPLSSIEYAYGFGVYETVRVAKGRVYFVDEHCRRLMESARIIGLEHPFTANGIQTSIGELVAKNNVEACNLKVMLIGAPAKEAATIDILCLNPLFPDRKFYKTGVACITQEYEREFPAAKTLNMLPSYLAYRKAQQHGAYDALLVNRQGCITESTRCNFFVLQGRRLISPKLADILPGVTRGHVIQVAQQQGFEVVEQDIPLAEVHNFDSACLTSTPIKVMPIRAIDGQVLWPEPAAALQELMTAFNDSLTPSAGDQPPDR